MQVNRQSERAWAANTAIVIAIFYPVIESTQIFRYITFIANFIWIAAINSEFYLKNSIQMIILMSLFKIFTRDKYLRERWKIQSQMKKKKLKSHKL